MAAKISGEGGGGTALLGSHHGKVGTSLLWDGFLAGGLGTGGLGGLTTGCRVGGFAQSLAAHASNSESGRLSSACKRLRDTASVSGEAGGGERTRRGISDAGLANSAASRDRGTKRGSGTAT